MNKIILFELLKIIDNRQSIYPLIRMGYRPSQIVILTQNVIESGYLRLDDGGIQLTEKGKNILLDPPPRLAGKGSERWIRPQDHFHVYPIGKYDIFVPKTLWAKARDQNASAKFS